MALLRLFSSVFLFLDASLRSIGKLAAFEQQTRLDVSLFVLRFMVLDFHMSRFHVSCCETLMLAANDEEPEQFQARDDGKTQLKQLEHMRSRRRIKAHVLGGLNENGRKKSMENLVRRIDATRPLPRRFSGNFSENYFHAALVRLSIRASID